MRLQDVKEKLIRFIPRRGRFFVLLRIVYKKILSWIRRRHAKEVEAIRKAFLVNKDALSITIDRDEGIIVEFPRGKFRYLDIDNPESACGRIVFAREADYETNISELVEKILQKGDTVFDIGANMGWHSVHFGRLVLPQGKLYCFEPNPSAFRELLCNVAMNFPGDRNVILENIALGDHEGKMKLYIPHRLGSLFSTLYPDTVAKEFRDFSHTDVAVTTLDSYVKLHQVRSISFIKCDVEGGELPIAIGADSVFARFAPIWLIEVNQNANRRIFSFFVKRGYSVFFYQKGTLYQLSDFKREILPDYNFLLVNKKFMGRIREIRIAHA